MAKMTEEMQTFVVQRLAMYDTPTTILADVNDLFGVTLSRQQIEKYNARRHGKKPAAKWVELFEATRARFIKEVSDAPIAHRSVRLRRLNRMAERAEERGNHPLAAQLMEQAAKEVGNTYTNRREVTGADGGPLLPYRDRPTEELAALAVQLAGEVGTGSPGTG